MVYEKNVYYAPETWGLELVGEIEYSSASYEFDTRVIWKDKNNQFFTARDSGCSCPTPFEDYETFDDLEKPTLKTLIDEINADIREYSNDNLQTAMAVIDNLRSLGLR